MFLARPKELGYIYYNNKFYDELLSKKEEYKWFWDKFNKCCRNYKPYLFLSPVITQYNQIVKEALNTEELAVYVFVNKSIPKNQYIVQAAHVTSLVEDKQWKEHDKTLIVLECDYVSGSSRDGIIYHRFVICNNTVIDIPIKYDTKVFYDDDLGVSTLAVGPIKKKDGDKLFSGAKLLKL